MICLSWCADFELVTQFAGILKSLGIVGSGDLPYSRFLKIYGKGAEHDKHVISTMKNVSVAKAKELIRAKIEGRLDGGPSGLRRAFQFFVRVLLCRVAAFPRCRLRLFSAVSLTKRCHDRRTETAAVRSRTRSSRRCVPGLTPNQHTSAGCAV